MFEFKGGIQVYSGFLADALHNLKLKFDYHIFLKNDIQATVDFPERSDTHFHFAGAYPLSLRTIVFSSQIFTMGVLQRPKLVIATHLNFAPAAYRLKQLTGIPYWTIAHGVDAWNIKNPDMQRALLNADLVIPVSVYTRSRLIKEQNLNPTKLSLLPNTFNSEQWHIAPKSPSLLERYHLVAQQHIILTVARLDSNECYKGYDQILKALPKIRDQIPDIHYVLIGKGDDRPRIEKLIIDLQLQDCVTLTGFIPDEEICDHYNLCDVFAMPSKGEGFGIVYLEAVACGKPTLGGNQDGAIDALCNGELGALVNPDDVNEIAQTLTQILQKTYPHPLMYQPELLREKVIDIYGFDRFKATLAALIHEWQQEK
jgi:glycosyltransferase involved in cell wall biosynthesis